MSNTIKTRIKLRTDTLTNWNDPENATKVKIYKGEAALGLDTSSNKYIIKIGTSDSGSYWSQLSEDLTIPAGNVIGLENTQYNYQLTGISADTENDKCTFKLQKKLPTAATWTDVTTVELKLTGDYSTSNPIALKDYVDNAINDASTQYYEGIRQSGESDADVIARVTSGITVKGGSTFVIKTAIAGANKYEFIAFTYNATTKGEGYPRWEPMDGNYNAENVYVDSNITIPATPATKITNGTYSASGKNLEQVAGDILEHVEAKVNSLDVSDTAVAKQFVTQVSETDGKISVTRRALESNDLPSVPVTKLALGANGEKIASNLLPSFVDDVIEFDTILELNQSNQKIFAIDNATGLSCYDSPLYKTTDNRYWSNADAGGVSDEFDSWMENTAYLIYALPYSSLDEDIDPQIYEIHAIGHGLGEGAAVIDPESGKIYVNTTNNKTYRWSGTQYTEISESLALGETDSTAYRGDRGKIAYDHATESGKVGANNSGFYKISTTSQGHVGSVTAVTKADVLGLTSDNKSIADDLNGKINKVENTLAGNLVTTNSDGSLSDAGYGFDYVPVIDGSPTNGELLKYTTDASGHGAVTGSGITPSNVVQTGDDRLKHASERSNNSDLGLISKSELNKVTGASSVSGSIAEAKAVADSKVKFLGTTTTDIVTNSTATSLAITGVTGNVSASEGDVVVYNNVEYRLRSGTWSKIQNAEVGAQVNVIEEIKLKTSDAAAQAVTITNKSVTIDVSGKVDKVAGKGLSTNDFTDALATKLNGIASGAQANVIETVKVKYNETTTETLTPSSKSVTVDVSNLILDGGSASETIA